MKRLFAGVWLVAAGALSADALQAGSEQAHVNYMLHCQGCHLPDAAGFPDKVPAMKDFVGYFLHSQEGREYLIRVPGVATSQLKDAEIAELMNWLITTYSAAQIPREFQPFTAEEVARLRKEPDRDPATSRRRVLQNMIGVVPALTHLEDDPH